MANSPEIAFQFFQRIKHRLKNGNLSAAEDPLDKLIAHYANTKFYHEIYPCSQTLYRARIYKQDDADSKYKAQIDGAFNGYDEQNSFVNLDNHSIPAGRCNPPFVPYLYTATSKKICLYEVRPEKADYVSIASIKILEPLRILHIKRDMAFGDSGPEIIPGVSNPMLGIYMAQEFSRTCTQSDDYAFCQYVSKKMKSYGFDGLAYTSSICPDSGRDVDIVIFNYSKCKAESSHLYKPTDISPDY